MAKIVIDPVTRIEGHLKIETVVENGVVKEARTSGTLFRGFEIILKGRDPRDAARLTQRVCGVCPIAHGTASILALDELYGTVDLVPPNGRLIRNIILGANYLQSHILHFYHLAALDFVDVTAVAGYEGDNADLRSVAEFIARGELAPFVPRYEGDFRLSAEQNRAGTAHYARALRMRRLCQELLALWGGKMPHECSLVPGGVTEHPTEAKIAASFGYLQEVRDFVDNAYLPDIGLVADSYPDYFDVGPGPAKFLSWGALDLQDGSMNYIRRKRFLPAGFTDLAAGTVQKADAKVVTEEVRYSKFDDGCAGSPAVSSTEPKPEKKDAYSWIKSPRYKGEVVQVGPLARMVAGYLGGREDIKALVDGVLNAVKVGPEKLPSVLGRHAARALETKLIADEMARWLLELKPGEPVCASNTGPISPTGVGLVGAPRGALGHWVSQQGGRVTRYQLVVPTTWNAGPRDAEGKPGAIEQALEGTKVKDEDNPVELVRIVRSFDPCLACAVHVVNAKGRVRGRARVC